MSRWSPAAGQPPAEREPWYDPNVVLGASGPTRVAREEDADPCYQPPRILGFAVADLDMERFRRVVNATGVSVDDLWPAPLLWDGDQA